MEANTASQQVNCVALIAGTVREPLVALDADGRVRAASRSFYQMFGLAPHETDGRRFFEIDAGRWNLAPLQEMIRTVLQSKGEFRDFQLEREVPNAGHCVLMINATRLSGTDSTQDSILLAIENISANRNTEAEISRQRQWFATTLSSIGDAVIATDIEARVTFMNPTAERLTGWAQSDASGRPLSEVFNIVNEDSRKLVESPVTKAIRMGSIVGLANHTVLISKDGTEWPIDDSAAPIRDEAGNILGVVMVFHDITERRAGERAQARLAEIVETSDDTIVAKDLNGIITAWNRAAERMFGYSAEEIVGKPIETIIPAERQDEETTVLSRIRRGERIQHFETVRRRKDGALVEISLSVSPIRNRRGEIIGASKVARDISERKRFEAEREAHLINEQSLRIEAEAANRAKDVFLATLSHELRTPLNAIIGWASILRREGCKEQDLHEGLDVINRNAKAQARLIEDVLDISRIVSGKLRLNIQRCELAPIISDAIEAVRSAAEAKDIVIEAHVDPAASPSSCDPVRLQQIVWNLLSNAIKFTPKGGHVTTLLERKGSKTVIGVSDTGQGIAPDFLPYVFERFRQADSTTKRNVGGLGLGLAIVKQLVEMHGGIVKAQSAGEGKGATFTVELPVAAVSLTPEEETERLSDEKSTDQEKAVRLDGLRIVVVDDEADARRMLSKVLTEAGAVVTVAATVRDGLEVLEKVRPNLVISDIGMPEQDGYDFIRQVRAAGYSAQSLPAVALTAFADRGYARSALLAGFQVYVAKPIEPRDLLAVVASLTGRTG
jgi:PAS domain S-box-containing protein